VQTSANPLKPAWASNTPSSWTWPQAAAAPASRSATADVSRMVAAPTPPASRSTTADVSRMVAAPTPPASRSTTADVSRVVAAPTPQQRPQSPSNLLNVSQKSTKPQLARIDRLQPVAVVTPKVPDSITPALPDGTGRSPDEGREDFPQYSLQEQGPEQICTNDASEQVPSRAFEEQPPVACYDNLQPQASDEGYVEQPIMADWQQRLVQQGFEAHQPQEVFERVDDEVCQGESYPATTSQWSAPPVEEYNSGVCLSWMLGTGKHPMVSDDEVAYIMECLTCINESVAAYGVEAVAHASGLGKVENSEPEAIVRQLLEQVLQERSRHGNSDIFVMSGEQYSTGYKKKVPLHVLLDAVPLSLEEMESRIDPKHATMTVLWDWNVKLECAAREERREARNAKAVGNVCF